MQKRDLNKQFWNVRKPIFRMVSWSPNILNEKILAITEESRANLTHLDVRALVSLSPRVEIPRH